MLREGFAVLASVALAVGGGNARSAEPVDSSPPPSIDWSNDYASACQRAKAEKKMLLVFFHNTGADRARDAFDAISLTAPAVLANKDHFVWARLPVNARIRTGGREIVLLSHAAFGEMRSRQGVAIVDYQNHDQPYYGHVVSAFPFSPGRYYTPHSLAIILGLPKGTLTQRTMVYAVRIHPESPASTVGEPSNVLLTEAERHSYHQASILLQGHHNWDNRFQNINSRLPSDLTAQEVVAESWGGESLVDACIECVRSWRQSSGHWSAVRSRQTLFGYDIKRGSNGVWYATGIFANRLFGN